MRKEGGRVRQDRAAGTCQHPELENEQRTSGLSILTRLAAGLYDKMPSANGRLFLGPDFARRNDRPRKSDDQDQRPNSHIRAASVLVHSPVTLIYKQHRQILIPSLKKSR